MWKIQSVLPLEDLSGENLLQSYSNRRSRPEVFCKKDILRNFAKFTGKRLCQSQKENLPQMFSCEFCEVSKNTFSYRTPLVACDTRESFVYVSSSVRFYVRVLYTEASTRRIQYLSKQTSEFIHSWFVQMTSIMSYDAHNVKWTSHLRSIRLVHPLRCQNRIQNPVKDGIFCKNSWWLEAVNYFR